MSRASAGSALRARELPDNSGVRILNIREVDHRDGPEESLLALLTQAQDVSSTSDELAGKATSWAEQYHLDPSRANVLRALSISAGVRILEVGAGCGALTRYLGEQGAEVDAVEPVLSRARVARERCRGLEGVEVFVGQIEDVPRAADYDLIVVVGVLEHIGRGFSGTEPHRFFLEDVQSRLAPGGSLILAIENKLGVKYLAGAPEDHYNVPFEGVEGYPSGGIRARTFSRRELEEMLVDVGLSPRTLAAFPDYKMTRAVLDPLALTGTPEESLLSDLPIFPSPDWVGTRSPAANERLLWRSLVEAGLALEASNSFLMVASNGKPSHELWPGNRQAQYFSWNRRREFTLVSTVERGSDHAVRIRREPLVPGESAGEYAITGSMDPFVAGTDFIDGFIEADEKGARSLIGQWTDLLRDRQGKGNLSFDCVPANLRIARDGALVFIDDEWRMDGVEVERVLRRGIILLALRFRGTNRRPGWISEKMTPREIAIMVGFWVGLEDPLWVDATIDEESALQAGIQRPSGRIPGERLEFNRNQLTLAMATTVFGGTRPRSIDPSGFGDSAHALEVRKLIESASELTGVFARVDKEHRERFLALERRAAEQATATQRKLDEMLDEREMLRKRLTGASEELSRMRATLSWRMTKGLRMLRRRTRKNGG